MSLDRFHLVFIACAAALAFLFGGWVLSGSQLAGAARVAAATAAFGVGLGLALYEAWCAKFLRRSR